MLWHQHLLNPSGKVEAIVLVPLSIGTCRRRSQRHGRCGQDSRESSFPMKQKNYIAVGKDGRKQKW